MNEKTQESYKKLAANFYKTRLDGEQLTPKKISDALVACASDYRPAYWRRLRNALAYDQSAKGFKEAAERINKAKNPMTKEGANVGNIKPKQARTKRVAEVDEAKLIEHLKANGDTQALAAITIAIATGARPSEFKNMVFNNNGDLVIYGSKVTEKGNRGADRIISLSPDNQRAVHKALMSIEDVGPVQDRIRYAAKKLWPQRKSVPSLYSWRHQMGSDLKASGFNRSHIAYVMGHQATKSVDVYGNSKTARAGRELPKPANDADLSNIRKNHSEPPAAAGAALAKETSLKSAPAVLVAPALTEDDGNAGSGGLKSNPKAWSQFHNPETQKRQGFEPKLEFD